MDDLIKDLIINIVAGVIVAAVLTLAIRPLFPAFRDEDAQIIAGLIVVIGLVVVGRWLRNEGPRRVDAESRISRALDTQRRLLERQLGEAEFELRQLEETTTNKAISDGLQEKFATLSRTIKHLYTRLSYLDGETVLGPTGISVFPVQKTLVPLKASTLSEVQQITSEIIWGDVIGLTTGGLIWVLVALRVGGPLGVSWGLAIGYWFTLLTKRIIAPTWYSKFVNSTWRKLGFWSIHAIVPATFAFEAALVLVGVSGRSLLNLSFDGYLWQFGLGCVVGGAAVTIVEGNAFWIILREPSKIVENTLSIFLIIVFGVPLLGVFYLLATMTLSRDWTLTSLMIQDLDMLSTVPSRDLPGFWGFLGSFGTRCSEWVARLSTNIKFMGAIVVLIPILIAMELRRVEIFTETPSVIRRLAQSVRLLSCYSPRTKQPSLRGVYLIMANLAEWDLSGADLRDANLSGADLTQSQLQGANLQGAQLIDARLDEANLTKANLRGADLRGASFFEAVLSCADLSDTDLRRANLQGAHLFQALFSGADVKGARIPESHWQFPSTLPANPSETTKFFNTTSFHAPGRLDCEGKKLPIEWSG